MRSHICVCFLNVSEVPLETPDGKELVITEEQLLQLGSQQDPGASNGYFFSRMRNKIVQMKSVLCLLEPAGENDGFSLSDLDHLENTPKVGFWCSLLKHASGTSLVFR